MTTRTAAPEERDPNRLTRWGTTWRVAAALLIGGVLWLLTTAVVFPEADSDPALLPGLWLVVVDPILGLVALGLLLLRRRWPVRIAVATTALTAVSAAAVGPQTVVLASLATRQRWREIIPVGVLTTAGGLVLTRFFYPDPEPLPLLFEAGFSILATGIVVAVGYSIGSRRALVRSWVDRARTAEAEQRARVEQAQSTERTRIAREMHDVLAHRISLVTMHSGVLAYRDDLPEAERRDAVAAIDSNARAALTDLREVLGVLRDPEGHGSLRPQSTLTDLPELVDGATSAGTRVTVETGGLDAAAVPETISRTAYRVAQEGLTNARKHAPGATVEITLAGRPGGELHIGVRNPRTVGVAPDVPTSGLGLLGLAERVELSGGRMQHGWVGEDEHRLRVWLPWPP
ncbi:sensor histidine kinase [Janibacter alittae]|uniref:histidine kinase n=1 Tax=Janibacter alittae TaxID=3115209 RepID=A0ABZ2MDK8_9MICO